MLLIFPSYMYFFRSVGIKIEEKKDLAKLLKFKTKTPHKGAQGAYLFGAGLLSLITCKICFG